MKVNISKIGPGPNSQRLDQKVIDGKLVTLDWDKDSINPSNPLETLPTGLHIRIGRTQVFVGVDELVAQACKELLK